MNFTDFQPLYDFSLLEKAIQSFFVGVDGGSFVAPPDDSDSTRESWAAGADNIAFYTAFQALTFTQCRPRVWIGLHNINCVRDAYALDANGNLREKAWTADLRIGLLTAPVYTLHTQLRSTVLAIIPQVLPQIAADNSLFATTGINSLLQYHQVSQFSAQNVSTTISPEDGNYQSVIPVSLAFNINPSAWPSGMQTY